MWYNSQVAIYYEWRGREGERVIGVVIAKSVLRAGRKFRLNSGEALATLGGTRAGNYANGEALSVAEGINQGGE